VGPRIVPEDAERRKSYTYWDSNYDPFAVQPVASCYTDCAISAHILRINNDFFSVNIINIVVFVMGV
jgi:hypothetical protein